LSTGDEQIWVAENGSDELVAVTHLRTELRRGINARVDLAPQLSLGVVRGTDDFGEVHVADDDEVDVAPLSQFVTGGGPMNERDTDSPSQRRQRVANDTGNPRGLCEK
jgi:hypothetical protein